jgi:hypothetical protein
MIRYKPAGLHAALGALALIGGLAACGTAHASVPTVAQTVTRTVIKTVPGPATTKSVTVTKTVPAAVECIDVSGQVLPVRDAGAIGSTRIDQCTMSIGDAGTDSAAGPALVLTDTANGASSAYGLQPIQAGAATPAAASNGLPATGVWYPASAPNVACGPPTAGTNGLNTSYLEGAGSGPGYIIDGDDPTSSPCNS